MNSITIFFSISFFKKISNSRIYLSNTSENRWILTFPIDFSGNLSTILLSNTTICSKSGHFQKKRNKKLIFEKFPIFFKIFFSDFVNDITQYWQFRSTTQNNLNVGVIHTISDGVWSQSVINYRRIFRKFW